MDNICAASIRLTSNLFSGETAALSGSLRRAVVVPIVLLQDEVVRRSSEFKINVESCLARALKRYLITCTALSKAASTRSDYPKIYFCAIHASRPNELDTLHGCSLVHRSFEPIDFYFLDQQLGFALGEHQRDNCEANLTTEKTFGGLVAP